MSTFIKIQGAAIVYLYSVQANLQMTDFFLSFKIILEITYNIILSVNIHFSVTSIFRKKYISGRLKG